MKACAGRAAEPDPGPWKTIARIGPNPYDASPS